MSELPDGVVPAPIPVPRESSSGVLVRIGDDGLRVVRGGVDAHQEA